jgi:Flp pilus assembly protein TadD
MACFKLVTGHLDSWEGYQGRGIERDAMGDHLGAAEDFAHALRLAPPNPALHFLRGVALLHGADSRGAAAEFQAGLNLDPNNATLRSLLDQAQHTSRASTIVSNSTRY